ncbi:sugar phosphate nucleotidyltransferase [Fibrobacter sp.]|uniref:sugar phosphate nucleotidyltransferase n=1 Tax=Fibrobacter sp. TaxID=35828 RepID=UPI00386608FA
MDDTRPLAPTETIFITGYKAEAMDRYLADKPECGKTRTVLQNDPQGLGQAISLALPYASDDEPLLIILGDTLFDADLERLAGESENVLYTYKVQDPRRFGVAVTNKNGRSPARAGGGLSRHNGSEPHPQRQIHHTAEPHGSVNGFSQK